MEITEEHLNLIWLGKKSSCERDCYCHAECNEADEYIDKLRKQVKSTLAPSKRLAMRGQANNVFELTKGFTTKPTDNAMKTLLEMAGYVLELTND